MSSSSPALGIPSFFDAFEIGPTGTPGRYRSEISDEWAAPIHPNGGVVSAIALRAMEIELAAPNHVLRSSTTVFASKVTSGPVEVDVKILRRGKRMSQLQALIYNPESGEVGHHLVAAFGEAREGYDLTFEEAPDVDGPEAYPGPAPFSPGTPAFSAGFFEQIDTRRIRMFTSQEEGWEGGTAEMQRWIRYEPGASGERSGVESMALLPLADTMPPALGQYLGPGHPLFHAPSVDLTYHAYADAMSDWILCRGRIRWAGDGYMSAEIHLWDEQRKLVGYATQMMILRFPDPEEFR